MARDVKERLLEEAHIRLHGKDGTVWETCTPLVRTPDGQYHSVISWHWTTDGVLMGMLIADKAGRELAATDDLEYYQPSQKITRSREKVST